MKKRLLSMLLVLAMCAALLPTIALADAPAVITLTQDSFDNATESTNPQKITETTWPFESYYVLPSGIYKLDSNVEIEEDINIKDDSRVTLDLAGYKLSTTHGGFLITLNGETASLTLNDSSSEQSGKLVGSDYAVYNRLGTFILNGGQLTANDITVANGGTLHLNGGEIGGMGTAIDNGGRILVDAGKEGTRVEGKVKNMGTIESGRFDGEVENGEDCLTSGQPEIKGGSFYGKVTNYAYAGGGAMPVGKKAKISGGVFYAEVVNNADGASPEITGGVFYGNVGDGAKITGGVFCGGAGEIDLTDAPEVTYDFGGDNTIGRVVGRKLSRPEDPTRPDDTFLGWYCNGKKWDFENDEIPEGTQKIKLQARWESEAEGEDFVIAGGLLSGILESAASALEETFVDVSRGAYYYNAVQWAAERGIAGGVDKKHFAPDESCTRAQAVTMLWRAAGCPAVWTENPFEDVDADDYYYEAVLWAVANGITSGADETHFSPDEPCTRGQIVTFLHRAERCYDAHDDFGFVDVKTGSYCEDAINWAVENAITNGTDVGAFSPDDTCTRGQIVTFLYRNR